MYRLKKKLNRVLEVNYNCFLPLAKDTYAYLSRNKHFKLIYRTYQQLKEKSRKNYQLSTSIWDFFLYQVSHGITSDPEQRYNNLELQSLTNNCRKLLHKYLNNLHSYLSIINPFNSLKKIKIYLQLQGTYYITYKKIYQQCRRFIRFTSIQSN